MVLHETYMMLQMTFYKYLVPREYYIKYIYLFIVVLDGFLS